MYCTAARLPHDYPTRPGCYLPVTPLAERPRRAAANLPGHNATSAPTVTTTIDSPNPPDRYCGSQRPEPMPVSPLVRQVRLIGSQRLSHITQSIDSSLSSLLGTALTLPPVIVPHQPQRIIVCHAPRCQSPKTPSGVPPVWADCQKRLGCIHVACCCWAAEGAEGVRRAVSR